MGRPAPLAHPIAFARLGLLGLCVVMAPACVPGGDAPPVVEGDVAPAPAILPARGATGASPRERAVSGKARAVAASTQTPAPPKAAGGEEVEALLRVLHHMTPPQKVKAYERLLASGQAGVEEVFLVGLNEDDPEILEVVVTYFETHHPEAAIEPLVQVLLFVQGDRALRVRVADAIASFGAAALGPVLETLAKEPPGRLAGGATEGFERILTGILATGGAPLLNRFLKETGRDGIALVGPLATSVESGALAADDETVALIEGHLRRELGRVRGDPTLVDGLLALLCRVAQGESLPGNVGIISPLIPRALPVSPGLWGLYAAVLYGDRRATPALLKEVASGGQRRFWALQALGVIGDERAIPAIIAGLSAPEEDVRAVAAWCVRHRLLRRASSAVRGALSAPGGPSLAVVEAAEALADPAGAPLLEASLAGAPRALQGGILRALLPVGSPALAERVAGWLKVELLAPLGAGRLDLEGGPAREVLEAGLWILAAYGSGGAEAVGDIARRLSDPGPQMPWILKVAAAGEGENVGGKGGGIGPLLEEAFLGRAKPPSREVARTLFLLAVGRGGEGRGGGTEERKGIRRALERILIEGREGPIRALAAQALFHVGSASSRPALIQALGDPYFRAGPFPIYEYPARRGAALALERLGTPVERRVDRTYVPK